MNPIDASPPVANGFSLRPFWVLGFTHYSLRVAEQVDLRVAFFFTIITGVGPDLCVEDTGRHRSI